MSCTFPKNRRWALPSLLTALVAAACLSLLGSPQARAGAYTYGTTPQRTVNAGILLVDGNVTPSPPNTTAANWSTAAIPDNKDPYVFYILSQRTDIVPFGWTIVNPLAPGTVTSQIKLRWDNRVGTTANTPSYQLGQSVTPAMAAYWEVPLTQTASDDLSKFDVLLLNVENACTLTAGDVEKLRRFVEGGGTLWIEDSAVPIGTGGSFTVEPAYLLGTLQFQGNTANSSFAALPGFTRSSLITTPYNLSENELNTLGDNHVGTYFSSGGSGLAPTVFSTLSVIVNNGVIGTVQPLIAAGQYGAGQVVVTCTGTANAINDYAGGMNIYNDGLLHPNSGPYCGTDYALAPTQDLKLTTDILASADGHPNEHQNSHQSGTSLSGLPAVAKSWSDTVNIGGQSGATVYGHLAYVTKNGMVYAYDLYPSEDLDGDGDPDDGNAKADPTLRDYDLGDPYDVVWKANIGGNLSAPTVAIATVGTTAGPAVFVEKADGTLAAFSATNGVSLGAPAGTPAKTQYGSVVPAPTFFEGRVYLGNADGALEVINLTGTAADPLTVNPNSGDAAKAIVASPTVGIVPSSRGDNDIVALCTTGNGLYSVYLGSRGEALAKVPSGYNTKMLPLANARMDIATGNYQLYSAPGTPPGIATPITVTTANAQGSVATPNFESAYVGDPVYGNYDVDIPASIAVAPAPVAPLTRTLVGGAPASGTAGVAVTNDALTGIVSAPALDRLGNVYYTVTNTQVSPATSVLYCVHDSPNSAGVHINWRFLLPTTGNDPGVDADGASYTALTGYLFATTSGATGGTATLIASAPVVDDQGNVYVLATNATNSTTAVLCFNGIGSVTANIGDASAQQSGVSVSQPLTSGADEFGGTSPATLTLNQFTVSAGGNVTFTNFGSETNIGTTAPGGHAVYPNLNEPYPVTIAYNSAAAQNQQAQGGVIRPLHTNLTWYTLLDGQSIGYTNAGVTKTVNRPKALATSGLTKAGNAVYFVGNVTDSKGNVTNGALAGVSTNPQTITKKVVESSTDPFTVATAASSAFFTDVGSTGIGTTTAVPSASNGVLLVNGPGGTTAFTNQITLVVDNNRVLEMDSNGDAEWAVDSTSKTTEVQGTSQFVTTTLELNRPTSITELTQNDYLIADTGNNRCVRFDRAGKVIWELTTFTDPNGLLKPGEPASLNQPTSVQITSSYDGVATSPTFGQTTVRYLISDTGNYRVVELDDIYDNTLKLIGNHVLTWTSHTHDLQDREYRYQSAAYYASPISGKFYVVALITNKRIKPFTYTFATAPAPADYAKAVPNLLAPSNQDVAGGTIVLLDYDPLNRYGGTGVFGTNGQADGFIGTTATTATTFSPIAISKIVASIVPSTVPPGLNDGKFDPTGASAQQTLYIRNPRYLKVLTKSTAGNPRHYLLADDNGVWDLDGNTFQATFGFTQADYQAMVAPYSLTAASAGSFNANFPRTNLPFIPSSIQLLGTDTVGNNILGRYLITNSFSQGEAANDVNKVGGEVFEIDQAALLAGTAPTGGYNNHTLSRPTNTSPLSQPAFAYRLQ